MYYLLFETKLGDRFCWLFELLSGWVLVPADSFPFRLRLQSLSEFPGAT